MWWTRYGRRMTGQRLWQVVIILSVGSTFTTVNSEVLQSSSQGSDGEATTGDRHAFPDESMAVDDAVRGAYSVAAPRTEAENPAQSQSPSQDDASSSVEAGRAQVGLVGQSVGHRLFGDQQPHDHVLRLEAAERSDAAAMKTAAVRAAQHADTQPTAPAADTQHRPKTFGVGHKLIGDQQLLEQLFQIEPSNEKLGQSASDQAKEGRVDMPESLPGLPSGVDGGGVVDPASPESSVNDMGSDALPRVSINTPTLLSPPIVDKPPPPPDTAEHLAPSGRRLVANKLYSQSQSSLPLGAGLSQDSAQLQVLTEISQHHVYVHPPKVYPVTPSPALSGPLLGGPRITAAAAATPQTTPKKEGAVTRFHQRPRALFVDTQSQPAMLDERTLRQSFEPVLYPRFYVVPYQQAEAEYRQRATAEYRQHAQPRGYDYGYYK